MLFTFRCLPCRVWHPPASGKACRHSPSPLSQSINNRPSPLVFHHSSSSPWSLSPELFVGSSFPSHEPFAWTSTHIWEKPHLRDDRFYWPSFHTAHLARDLFLAFLLTFSPVWRRALFPLTSWIAVLRVPHLRLLEWSSTFLSPSLSVLLFSAHSWPPVPRSISVATIVHGVLGDRHRHDNGVSKVEPAESYRLCVETNRTNASHHPERVSYCAAGEWMAWCCCQRSGDISCRSLACGNWAASSSSARLGFRHQLVLTWQRLD